MADQPKNDAPEGLDEFLSSDDPMAARQAQGLTSIANTVGPAVTQNLQDSYNTANAAAHGDPQAQQQFSNDAVTAVAGSMAPVGGTFGPMEASEGILGNIPTQKSGYLNKIGILRTAMEVATTDKELKAATSAFNREIDKLQRLQVQSRAEGGEIAPAGMDQFLAQAEDARRAPSLSGSAKLPNNAIHGKAPPPGLDEFIAPEMKEAKYGTVGQQALTALEGAGQGATFGASTALEKGLGVDPEDIRNRAETNPVSHIAGQIGGVAATALIPGVGEENILAQLGEAGTEGLVGSLGREAGSTFLNQVTRDTVKGAFEASLFQGGEEVHKMFTEDPNQSAETAIADIGLAGIMGGMFAGGASAGVRALKNAVAPEVTETAPRFVSELDRPALEAGDLKASVENSNVMDKTMKERVLGDLNKDKADAPEIRKAAERLGAPVMEGMTSDSRWVQRAEDSLINGAPTYSGIKRRELYDKGFNIAKSSLDSVLGEEGQYSKAELGNSLKDSITKQIKQQSEPIAEMYNYIKQYHDIIPVNKSALEDVANSMDDIRELKLSPSSPGAKIANDVISELGNIKTVDDLKAYKSMLYDRLPPTAAAQEKRVVGIVADKLKSLEEASIEGFAKEIPANDEAKAVIENLITQRKAADAAYKPFIKKIQTLSDQLGKGRIHGAQDAINFINDLTPEQVTQRLFNKNNSEFLKFFSKEFPEQMSLMQKYQKGLLRESATRAEGFSPNTLFTKIDKLEPEIQKSIFNKEELAKINDAKTYIQSFPKNFNPSGTERESAMRSFFEHPTGALIANVRDLGIEKFIKGVANTPEAMQASTLAKATVSGYKQTAKAIKAILNPANVTMPTAIISSSAAREKIKKQVEEYTGNPTAMNELTSKAVVPEYNQAFAATSMRAVQYLNSIKPNTTPKSPLDPKPTINKTEEAAYNRALDIANNPAIVLKHINDGTLTSKDLQTLNAVYPNYFKQVQGQLTAAVMNQAAKGKAVPYAKRVSLSLFAGKPLDSTMTPSSIMSAQPQPAQPSQGGNSQVPGNVKHSTAKLNKISDMYKTPGESAEGRRARE